MSVADGVEHDEVYGSVNAGAGGGGAGGGGAGVERQGGAQHPEGVRADPQTGSHRGHLDGRHCVRGVGGVFVVPQDQKAAQPQSRREQRAAGVHHLRPAAVVPERRRPRPQ